MSQDEAGTLFPVAAAAARGGKARAAKMTKAERSASARVAAESRWEKEGKLLPRATHEGKLVIGGNAIPCAVLENGTRVLSERGVLRQLGRGRGGYGYKAAAVGEEGGARLPLFISAKNLRPFIDNDLAVVLSDPLMYRPISGSTARGLNAELIPRVCDVWLRARDAGALNAAQMATALKADMLIRALAGVGIIALVDEATGYQEVRDRLALEKILDLYLQKEFAAWSKRFPDEFYREIFRLRNWPWPSLKGKGPRVIANYTNDVVYSRLAPGILEELEERNPIEDGKRAAKHHQLLTLDIGHPALAAHLHAVMAFMRASKSWEQFKASLDVAFPRMTKLSDLPLFNPPAAAIGSGQPS